MEFENFEAVRQAGERALGVSSWQSIDTKMVQTFADLTGDHQWIHLNPVRAQTKTPFGGAIVHGAFILSLVPVFAGELFRVANASLIVNAGMNRARLRDPVPVGSIVRGRAKLRRAEPFATGLLVYLDVSVEVASQPRAACTAEQIMVLYA